MDEDVVTADDLNNVTYLMNEDDTLTIVGTQLLTDAGVSAEDLPSVSVTSVTAADDIHGAIQDNGDGTWTYTPLTDFNGAVSFNFAVFNGIDTFFKQISLTVNAVNDAPVPVPVTLDATEDTAVTFTNAQLVGASTDADNDTLLSMNVSVTHGSIVANPDGSGWTFTPDPDFNGQAVLSYEIFDGVETSLATALINVAATNDPPATLPVILSATEDTAVIFTNEDLVGMSTDPDADPLTAVNVVATNGSIVKNADNTWTFKPDLNFNGVATLTFDIFDGTDTKPSSATINVAPVNDPPVTMLITPEDTPLILTNEQLVGGSTDPDGDPLVAINVTCSDATIEYNDTKKTWTFKPNANVNGTVMLNYEVSDGTSSTPATKTVTVFAVNDAPVPVPVVLQATEDVVLIITNEQLVGASTDVDGDPLTAVNVVASHGTIAKSGDDWSFTPDRNYNGVATLSYELFDGTTAVPSFATVHVAPVNDPPVTSLTTTEDTPLLITNAQLVAGSTDPDGDPLTAINVTVSSGSIEQHEGPTWIFKPEPDFDGEVTVDFEVSDGVNNTASSTKITVLPAIDVVPLLSGFQLHRSRQQRAETAPVAAATSATIAPSAASTAHVASLAP